MDAAPTMVHVSGFANGKENRKSGVLAVRFAYE